MKNNPNSEWNQSESKSYHGWSSKHIFAARLPVEQPGKQRRLLQRPLKMDTAEPGTLLTFTIFLCEGKLACQAAPLWASVKPGQLDPGARHDISKMKANETASRMLKHFAVRLTMASLIMKFAALVVAILFAVQVAFPQWTKYDVGTDSSFRGLDVESRKVIWASGTGGTVIRTIDGGKTWKVFKVPGAEKLDFRDIEAFGKNTAYVLSIGNGGDSRIYKTTDGGANWTLRFTNSLKDAFFDSIAFWDENHGIAQSDPIDGRYVFYETRDGETWNRMDPARLPPAEEGEAAFAASGTCIVTRGKNEAFLVTGGKAAHVYHSNDRGQTWTGTEAPLISGDAATGVFGIAFKGKRAMIVGGDYTKPDENNSTVAYSEDGGKTWQTKRKISPFGYRSGVTFVSKKTAVVVGIKGSDITRDAGTSWQALDQVERNTVMSKGKNAVWAVGPKGEVSKLEIR